MSKRYNKFRVWSTFYLTRAFIKCYVYEINNGRLTMTGLHLAIFCAVIMLAPTLTLFALRGVW